MYMIQDKREIYFFQTIILPQGNNKTILNNSAKKC